MWPTDLMTPSICSMNVAIGRANQWAQEWKCQQASDISCSCFLIAMDSVVKPSLKLGDLCPCFRNRDHVCISQNPSGRRGRSDVIQDSRFKVLITLLFTFTQKWGFLGCGWAL